ncbi:MAG TPA: hypothetical protein VME66_14515 [Candidatus Acidoferrales bacterium]|nr:hypothetical protein [Candidatus Acidoferrales bacterium]
MPLNVKQKTVLACGACAGFLLWQFPVFPFVGNHLIDGKIITLVATISGFFSNRSKRT